MEEANTPIDTHEDRSAKTAETLRALREQAEQALQSHLRRIEETEEELSQRINNLAEELSRDDVASKAQTASLLEQLNERGEALQNTEVELTRLQQELESLQNERSSLSEELEEVLTERLKETEEKAQLQAELERLEALAQQHTQEREVLAGELQQLGTDLELTSTECQQLNDRLEESQEQRDEADRECERLNDQIAKLGEQIRDLEAQRQELNTQAEQTQNELVDFGQVRDQLTCVEAELAEARQQLTVTQASLEQAQRELEESRSLLEQSQQQHAAVQESLETAQAEHQQRLEELQQQIQESESKCELALADVHKLKKTNAELHEQLDSRPETSEADSAEVVHLRAERDQLAERVQELETLPSSDTDGDSQQKLADLQARFEMAVEDVRSLKQENESLKGQLAAGGTAAEASAGGGYLDWQAQKARLLQELDAENCSSATPERQEQLATIEGTIAITDKVVADKDREIAELRSQMAANEGATLSEEEIEKIREEAVREAQEHILQEDKIIQAERARLAQLQEEWKEKLRTAELEVSVQRAEIAREKAKLEEQLSFLESQKQESASGEKPRRRWLSALGIKDDDEQTDG